MGFRSRAVCLLFFLVASINGFAGQRADGIYCVGDRKFQGSEPTAFNFDTKHFVRLNHFASVPLKEAPPELRMDVREDLDIPKYVKDLEGDPASWIEDHRMGQYADKLEHIVFGGAAPCKP